MVYLSVSNISGSESHTFYIVGLCLLGFAGSVALFMPFFVFIQVSFKNMANTTLLSTMKAYGLYVLTASLARI